MSKIGSLLSQCLHSTWFIWLCSMVRHWNTNNEQRWIKIRQKGPAVFVLVRGVLVYGSCVLVPLLLLTLSLHSKDKLPVSLSAALINATVVTLLGSILFGVCAWFATESSFRKYKADKVKARSE